MFRERLVSQEEQRQEAVALYKKVRDVPYKLGLDGDPTKLFREGYGNCVRKLLYLAPRLGPLGYKVTGVGVAVFDWKELPIPKDITRLLRDSEDLHPFLYIKNHLGTEISLDASWDSKMPDDFRKLDWDGIDSTGLGVLHNHMFRESLGMVGIRVLLSLTAKEVRKVSGAKRDTPFNDAFNKWLGRD